jgi:hypothetical protein
MDNRTDSDLGAPPGRAPRLLMNGILMPGTAAEAIAVLYNPRVMAALGIPRRRPVCRTTHRAITVARPRERRGGPRRTLTRAGPSDDDGEPEPPGATGRLDPEDHHRVDANAPETRL